MATRNNFLQPYDQFNKLNDIAIEEVMKCAVDVAEDMQEEGQKYDQHVDKIELYLMEFAKLSEDVTLRKAAMDKVRVANSELQEDDEPPDLSVVFETCLEELEAAKKASYDPKTHPIVEDFSERVRNAESDSGEEDESAQNNPDETDLVVGQVDISLKCPITKVFFEDPVTSTVCHHSYSRGAIIAHIKQSRRIVAKCPVCGVVISESDLVKDKKLEKMVRKAKKQKTSSHTSFIKL